MMIRDDDIGHECDRCGVIRDPVAFDPMGEAVRAGAFDVCPHCGSVGIFGEELYIRRALADELFDGLTYRQIMRLAGIALRGRTVRELRRIKRRGRFLASLD